MCVTQCVHGALCELQNWPKQPIKPWQTVFTLSLQAYPNLEGHALQEGVAPNLNKPTDHHQKDCFASFGLYNFLEVFCNAYWLLQVWRVG